MELRWRRNLGEPDSLTHLCYGPSYTKTICGMNLSPVISNNVIALNLNHIYHSSSDQICKICLSCG